MKCNVLSSISGRSIFSFLIQECTNPTFGSRRNTISYNTQNAKDHKPERDKSRNKCFKCNILFSISGGLIFSFFIKESIDPTFGSISKIISSIKHQNIKDHTPEYKILLSLTDFILKIWGS